jgi:hypothetical protein
MDTAESNVRGTRKDETGSNVYVHFTGRAA